MVNLYLTWYSREGKKKKRRWRWMPTRGRSSLFSNRYTSLATILFIFPKRPLFCVTGLALGVGQKCPEIRTHGTLCCKVTHISSPHSSLDIGQCNLTNLVNILTTKSFPAMFSLYQLRSVGSYHQEEVTAATWFWMDLFRWDLLFQIVCTRTSFKGLGDIYPCDIYP